MAAEVQGVCVSDDDACWLQLEDHRLLLIKSIEPSLITPYLRQCQVISAEDEEQIFNDPSLVIRRRKVGALLDILQRTGVKGYTAFLESLELDYPQLYTRITGKTPNKTFSILIDTAGESGLTQFLMSEVTRLQRALQMERRRRQEACAVVKEQEDWSRQQQLRDRELSRLTERVQKAREERERLNEEVMRLREHNYSLMADMTAVNQEKNNLLLANRDLQIEVERLKCSVQTAECESRLARGRTVRLRSAMEERPQQEALLSLQTHNMMLRAQVRELENVTSQSRKQEEKKEETRRQEESAAPPQLYVLSTIFKLRTELHRAEEGTTKIQEEKEEVELSCARLRGDVKMYRKRNKETLRQLEEVARERDKALSSRAELQAESRAYLLEKDQYREAVRQLTQRCDRLQLLLLRSQEEVLQLQTRLRKMSCSSQQSKRTSEGEDAAQSTAKGSSEDGLSATSGENEASNLQHHHPALGGSRESRERPSTAAPWEAEVSDCHQAWTRNRPNFLYRRKRALRSKFIGKEHGHCNLDDSSGSDITDSDGI
ncbi:caspase recruitment domain-containing protein 9 [Lampris incognitus]|uniref:caspase recruitment domain-containing protein 9 n=1 Tax=Lampris incognitus TaxID=2546036 RepID=UPI0024B54AB2|nr:caspase recruitment domain-containing protein 9 [Lampris incognitus]